MKQKARNRRKLSTSKTILRLPDLEVARSAVLNSLSCPDAQRGYRHAIDEFVDWYCSEPPLSFSKTVVTRYRMHLESRGLAPGTINLRLGAVRRLAYEAADCGLLSADLAAGIRRVKGVKKLGVRLGNWLTRRADGRSSSATRRTLGIRRPSLESWARSNHPCSGLGAESPGRVDESRRNRNWQPLPPREQC
jgi:hypothetical protein